MHFKLVSKNGYRDLVRNARRISISELSVRKTRSVSELFELLKPRLGEQRVHLTLRQLMRIVVHTEPA